MRRWRIFGPVAVVLALALGLSWLARVPIAEGAIERELARRGVTASYRIAAIGPRTQRLENVRLGDPAHPDLTADWAEVDLAPSWGGVAVTAVRASGVVLRGRLVGSKITWGAVDKLLPPPSDKAFALPAIDADLRDAKLLLATDYGNVGVRVDGRGRLDNGFRGEAVIAASRLGRIDCFAQRVRGAVGVQTAGEGISLQAARMADFAANSGAFDCRGIAGPSLSLVITRLRLHSNFSLDEYQGGLLAERATAPRGITLTDVTVVAANRGRQVTRPDFAVDVREVAWQGHRALDLQYTGDLHWRGGVSTAGRLIVSNIVPDQRVVAALNRMLQAEATLLEPTARALRVGVGRLRQGVLLPWMDREPPVLSAQADVTFNAQGVTLGTVTVSDTDQPLLTVTPGSPTTARLRWPGFAADATIARGTDGIWGGVLTVAPMVSAKGRVALAPVRFVVRPDGAARVETSALIDGPFPGGRVEGLRLPVVVQRQASGAFVVAPGCTPVAFARVTYGDIRLDPARATLCANGARGLIDGGRTGPLRLTGRSGSAPLSLALASARIGGDGSIAADRVAVRLGETRLEVARLTRDRFTGLSGAIANVPLAVTEANGRWALGGGTLTLTGALRVADTATPARFEPLVTDDARLTLADGKIAATATLREPITRRAVTSVTIAHTLASGSGNAVLRVDALTFGKTLQPEALTRSTFGVIANVQGQIDGRGTIRWTRDGLTSEGRFRTDNLDFAAALGPVSGVRGTIVFNDLLALTTPPGQVADVAVVNPGVEIKDGRITYRLARDRVVVVEGGAWPFARGQLTLGPAELDFGRDTARRLSVRVTGIDAGAFIDQLKLDNIAATGTFDGTLPVVFDATGGRIEGGRIVARGRGTLAYVGDVSNAQLNSYARVAFDALKSLRYDSLTIELDGALDGEIVSRVRFDGVNQSPVAPTGAARSFTGLPFRFNVVVRAPFRGLVGTARSLQDPAALLVQPPASGVPR